MSWRLFDELIVETEAALRQVLIGQLITAPSGRLRRWQRDASSLRLLSSAIALVDAEPELAELGPDGLAVAWRIFRPGWNTSRNGPVLFDELAAELVMADYREHGARIQVDMDHVSLNKESKAYDPRGLGYHDLELREDGSLWACNAVWTTRGAACLASDPKTGRAAELPYYSPAFDTDTDLQFGDEPDRVTYIFNGGLVGTPATDRPMQLAAANRQKGHKSMDPKKALKIFRTLNAADRERLIQIWKLTPSQAELPSAKLAQLLKWQDSPEDVDPKVLAKMVQAMGGDASQGIGGLMRQLRQFMEMAMKALMGEQPAPEAVPMEGEPETMADNPGDKREPELMAASRKHDAELRKLRQEREADRKLVDELRQERAGERHRRRMDLLALAVSTGRLDRARAYEDPTVKTAAELKPKGSFATMSLEELKTEWTEGPVLTNLFGAAPQPASGYSGAATQPGLFEMSQLEEDAIKDACEQSGRPLRKAMRHYRELRTMQVKGARNAEQKKLLGRRLSADLRHPDARNHRLVLSDATLHFTPDDLENYRTWASQAPIADFSAVSILAMNEFDLRYNVHVATPPIQWVEVLGDIRASGSIGDVLFPIDFALVQYQKVTAQHAGAETPTIWWVDVRKEEYFVAAEADIRLLNEPGSFDYLNDTWLRQAADMAEARWDLKAELAIEIFTQAGGGAPIYVNREKGALTGKRIFSVDHPIHPFKPEIEDINGGTTWDNYTTAATPFNATNLTAQKTKFNLIPNRRGRFMAMPATHVVGPTSLTEEVNNKIRVQDLILAGALSGGGDGTMGTERNPHTGSGLLSLEVPHMPGVDSTADWMLFSAERKARGMVPFVVAESAAEEVIVDNEGSHYTNRTRFIKQERRTFIKVVPMHPEAVLYVKGS